MSELSFEIDKNWYCIDCSLNFNCTNCNVMNQLVDSRYKIISILELAIEQNESQIIESDNKENKKTYTIAPVCWTCWRVMKKSNRKKWAKYWCTCRY